MVAEEIFWTLLTGSHEAGISSYSPACGACGGNPSLRGVVDTTMELTRMAMKIVGLCLKGCRANAAADDQVVGTGWHIWIILKYPRLPWIAHKDSGASH
jgi:hypothetical protein